MNRKGIIVVLAFAAVAAFTWWHYSRVEVRFASDGMDFARLEYEYPLSREEREWLTPERLAAYPQEQVDQIYGRLTA